MDLGLNGKAVLITGASRGIGLEIKKAFEQSGAVVISPTREEMDLKSSESIDEYFESNGLKNIDVFVHCAGINILSEVEQITSDLLNKVFQVNTFSAVQIASKIMPNMKNNNWGRIVLISSLYSIVTRENRLPYSASKNALTGVAKTLALEGAKYNILTNCVAPGYVVTEMTKQNLSSEEITTIEKDIPTNRFQTSKEIADLALFLCSDINQSITGQLIAVDGGYICK